MLFLEVYPSNKNRFENDVFKMDTVIFNLSILYIFMMKCIKTKLLFYPFFIPQERVLIRTVYACGIKENWSRSRQMVFTLQIWTDRGEMVLHCVPLYNYIDPDSCKQQVMKNMDVI